MAAKMVYVLTAALLLLVRTGAGQDLSQKCAGLTGVNGKSLPNPTTAINSAHLNAAATAPALPEHCEVLGKMNERTGVNGQTYAIKFHLRLPSAWNGRF